MVPAVWATVLLYFVEELLGVGSRSDPGPTYHEKNADVKELYRLAASRSH